MITAFPIMKRATAVVALLLLLQFSVAQIQEPPTKWLPQYFPNPQRNPLACGRNGNNRDVFVCDPNGILGGEEDWQRVDNAARHLRVETDCTCPEPHKCKGGQGFTLSVAIVKGMADPDEDLTGMRAGAQSRSFWTTAKPSADILQSRSQRFAEMVRSNWALGQCDDDMVIFASLDDRRLYTSVGQVTALRMNHFRVNEIFEENRDYFRRDDFVGGLVAMIEAYKRELKGTSERGDEGMPAWAFMVIAAVVFVLALVAVIVFLVVTRRQKEKRRLSRDDGLGERTGQSPGKRLGKMSKIEEEDDEAYTLTTDADEAAQHGGSERVVRVPPNRAAEL